MACPKFLKPVSVGRERYNQWGMGLMRNGMVAVGAALLLCSTLAATDALAGNKVGQTPVALKAGGKQGSKYKGLPTKPTGSGANFGMSGPYVGMKYIGNVP